MMFCIETWNKSFCKEVSQFLNRKQVVSPKHPLLDHDDDGDDDAQDEDDGDDGDVDHGEEYTMPVMMMMMMMIGEGYTRLLGEMSQSVQSPRPLC